MIYKININEDSKCAECGKGGAVDSGLCLKCCTKAMGVKPMKSAIGKSVRARFEKGVHLRAQESVLGRAAGVAKKL